MKFNITVEDSNIILKPLDHSFFKPLEVKVFNSFEDAYRRFKTLVQSEGILKKIKEKQAYEKPSVKARRKRQESLQRQLIAVKREADIASGEFEQRQKRKEQKRLAKIAAKQKLQEENGDAKCFPQS